MVPPSTRQDRIKPGGLPESGRNSSSPKPPPETPVSIPDHELIRRIGKGSYGQVWLARSVMGMYRAVKIVFQSSFETQRPFDREISGIRRFEPISRSHEGFVDVLQVGINKECGYFYYVMELGDDFHSGQTFDAESYVPKTLAREISSRGRLPLKQCLQLGIGISLALAELHRRGLVHRDVKPSNIIFVGGTPKLADIGLVAGLDEARSYVGTEGFIPPEGPGTPQADVYSLGKVLYEASTGKDRQDFPELPEEWSESQDYSGLIELNEVLVQACKPDPLKRYLSAADIHSDLLVVLTGKSVKRLRLLERRMENLKKAGTVAMLLLLVFGLFLYQLYGHWSKTKEARRQRANSAIAYGNAALKSGDLFGSLPYFTEALRFEAGNADRERINRLRLGSTLAQCPKLVQMWTEPMRVDDAEFSPDGQKVLITEHYYGQVELRELKTGKLYRKPFGAHRGLTTAVFNNDGTRILTASQDTGATVWDAQTLTPVLDLAYTNGLLDARFSPDGRHIATSCLDGIGRIWDAKTGKLELTLQGHTGAIISTAFSPNGHLIATASRDGTARIWDAETGRQIGRPFLHATWVTCVTFSPHGDRLVTTCADHQAHVWDVATGSVVYPLLEHDDVVRNVEFSPDGRIVLTASLDGTVRLWAARDFRPLEDLPILRQPDRVTHATFSPDSRLILIACVDGSVRVWDLAGSMIPPEPRDYIFCANATKYLTYSNESLQVWDSLSHANVSPQITVRHLLQPPFLSYDGRFAVTLNQTPGERGIIQVWNSSTGRPLGPGIACFSGTNGVALSSDAHKLIIWEANKARTFDTATGNPLSPLLLHTGLVSFALFDPAGEKVVTVSKTSVQVWNSVTGHLLFRPIMHEVPVSFVQFTRDGRLFVTCSADAGLTKCFAQIWNSADGSPHGDRLSHSDGVLSASFNYDGTRIATASEDYSARIWETVHGAPIGLALRHRDQVWSSTFSTDGKLIATASADRTARIWDVERDDPVTPPLRHPNALTSIQFLPDQTGIVTADRQGRCWIWPMRVEGKQLTDFEHIVEFLTGAAFYPVKPKPEQGNSAQLTWNELRTRFPELFSTTTAEIVAWHRFQAEQCESDGDWSAAIFHLNHLLAIEPNDTTISNRITRATRLFKSHE